jgi:hypothetical protein
MELLENSIARLLENEATWMPLYDECEDYHRINDEYPKSYVKAKTHSFMFHFFKKMNSDLLQATMPLWDLKLQWGGVNEESAKNAKLTALPSDGYIARVVSHLYPAGGGYLAKHRDPINQANMIQTLIVGSQFGRDFKTGGLYVYATDGTPFFVDECCDKGDLLLFDQSFQHEVKPVDVKQNLDWGSMAGRLQHVLLFTRSDYLKGSVADVES